MATVSVSYFLVHHGLRDNPLWAGCCATLHQRLIKFKRSCLGFSVLFLCGFLFSGFDIDTLTSNRVFYDLHTER